MTMKMMVVVRRKSDLKMHIDLCTSARTHTNALIYITPTLETPGLLQMKSTSDYNKTQSHAITHVPLLPS